MSATARARRLQLEEAERRVVEQLKVSGPGTSARRGAVCVAVAILAGCSRASSWRAWRQRPDALLANFYVVPIAVLATEFGARAGFMAARVALGLVFAWSAVETVHVDALGYISRGAVLVVAGAVVGRFSERLRLDITARQRAQRDLSLYADQLERANQNLARSVEQLEAFAEIARAVGGETDLERCSR